MSDDSLCIGTNCPVKEKCERYEPNKIYHHMASDYVYIEKFGCDEFILKLDSDT